MLLSHQRERNDERIGHLPPSHTYRLYYIQRSTLLQFEQNRESVLVPKSPHLIIYFTFLNTKQAKKYRKVTIMIVYCVICRQKDASVLCELHDNSDLKGNAPQVTTALLEHLCAHPETFNEGDLKTYVNRSDGGGGSSWGGGGSGFFGRGRGRQQQQQDPNDMFNQFLHACTIPITSVTADEELDLGNIQEHYFHVWNYDGVFYCCLSDDRNQKDQKVYVLLYLLIVCLALVFIVFLG